MKPMLRHLRILCLSLGIATMVISPGCATFASDLTAFRSAIDVADMVIDAIDDFVNGYFTAHPDPAKLAEIKAAEAQARTAAAAALALANGAGDASTGNVAQAFQDFETAYSSLLALAQSLGVKAAAPGSKVGVSAGPGVLVVPAPADLRPSMVKEVARPAVSLRSPGDSTVPLGPIAAVPPDSYLGVGQNGQVAWVSINTNPIVGDWALTVTKPTKEARAHQWDGHQWLRVRGGALVHWSAFENDWNVLYVDPALAGAKSSKKESPAGRMDPVRAPAGRAYSYAGENVGAAEHGCDVACGNRDALSVPDGCQCWLADRKNWRNSRWVPLREAPGAGLVATR